MTKEEILHDMDMAFKEDRDRLFKVADTLHLQPKYAELLEELEALKQVWRDIPDQEGYPIINHPLPLPEWFPEVRFMSSFQGVEYLEGRLAEEGGGDG